MNEPITLTDKVPKMFDVNKFLLRFVRQNLNMAPVAPPVATKNKFNNFFYG